MVFSKIILAAAVAAAAPADMMSPSAPNDCFPSNTQTLISDFELRSINMQYGLAQGNDQAGKQAHTEMKDLLDMISAEIDALGNCENHLPLAWPKQLSAEDSKDRALELLQQANKEMELLRDPVAKCNNHAGALKKVCDARAVVDEIDLYPGYVGLGTRQAANCSYDDWGDTKSLIYRTESAVDNLRIAVEFDMKENVNRYLGPMNQKIDELSVAIGAGQRGDLCSNPRPKPWPKMKSKKSRDHAVELLDSVYNNLQLLETPVEKCDRTKSLIMYCRERAVIDHVNLYPGLSEDLTARSEQCFPDDTRSLITDFRQSLLDVITSLGTEDDQWAKEAMVPTNEAFVKLSIALGAGGYGEKCHNSPTLPWPNLPTPMPADQSRSRALRFAAAVEDNTFALDEHVEECNRTDAFHLICENRVTMNQINLYPGFSGQVDARSEDCWDSSRNLTTLSQLFKNEVTNAMISLRDHNDQASKQAIVSMNQTLGNFSEAIGIGRDGEECENAPAPAWPNMSPDQSWTVAYRYLELVSEKMDDVDDSLEECYRAHAISSFCYCRKLINEVSLYPVFL